jgi:branched-chain amino acid transport system substrate-binding protein
MSDSWLTSVVLIKSSDPNNPHFGTGFLIHEDSQGTYILTCRHVIDDIGGPNQIRVQFTRASEGESVRKYSEVLAQQKACGDEDDIDLAVLYIEGLQNLPLLRLRVAENEKNESFRIAGFSQFAQNTKEFRVLQGIFVRSQQMGKNHFINAWDVRITEDGHQIESGNSGSPVVDKNNYVTAVVIARTPHSIGRVISIEALETIWSDMPLDLLRQVGERIMGPVPRQIGDYIVQEVLHVGKESVICKAKNTRTEALIALKLLPIHNPTTFNQQAFKEKVEELQSVGHLSSNIMPLITFGRTREYIYLVMPYVSDRSLADVVARGRQFFFDHALESIQQVAQALTCAHQNGIIHGKVKPGNLLMGSRGLLLSDFALAPSTYEQGQTDYSSPEQTAGKPASPASDQYALAMTTCWLLTGTTPALGALEILRSKDYGAVAQVLEQALARDPTKRYPSVSDFAMELEHAGLHQVNSLVPPRPERPPIVRQQPPRQPSLPRRRFSRHQWIVAVGVFIIVAALLGALIKVWPFPSPSSVTFCIGTDFPTTPGRDASGAYARNGADLAIQQNANLGFGYTLSDTCHNINENKDDDNGSGVHDHIVGLTNLKALIADNSVLGIVGPGNSDIAQADIPVASQNDFAMVSPDTTAPCLTLSPYCFPTAAGVTDSYMRICANDLQQAQADVDFLLTSLKNLHTAFVVDDGQLYGQGFASDFTKDWEKQGGMIRGQDSISSSETSTQLAQLAQKIASLKPDVVFYGGLTVNGIGYLKAQLVTAGFTGPLMSGDGIALDLQYIANAGSQAANNTYATSLEPDISTLPKSFVNAYYQDYQTQPGFDSAGGYDAAMILIRAIKSLIATDPQVMQSNNVKTIRSHILTIADSTVAYSGLTGTITFDNGDNVAVSKFAIYSVENGQWIYQSTYVVND